MAVDDRANAGAADGHPQPDATARGAAGDRGRIRRRGSARLARAGTGSRAQRRFEFSQPVQRDARGGGQLPVPYFSGLHNARQGCRKKQRKRDTEVV